MRISDERQQSNIRVAEVEMAIVKAIGETARQHPQLTSGEILAGMLSIASRRADRILRDATEES